MKSLLERDGHETNIDMETDTDMDKDMDTDVSMDHSINEDIGIDIDMDIAMETTTSTSNHSDGWMKPTQRGDTKCTSEKRHTGKNTNTKRRASCESTQDAWNT